MPSVDSQGDFLRDLETSGCLSAEQFQDITIWAKTSCADASTIAKELNKRVWMSAHQIREIYRGRVSELTVGVYRIIELIGEGGMGRVYRAHHTRLSRDVALKVIRKEKLTHPQTIRRFRQEIQAVAQLSHPNVVLAFDADEANGNHYLAMEYVDGVDLTKLVRDRGPLPIPIACDYIRQASLGLHHAYERGLVHRDIKPSNMIVSKSGQVKILDLGLAMLNENSASEDSNRVTQEGYVIGTPDFLAPEQARNPLQVDTRADIYALGATLYFLVTGRVPYEGSNSTEKLLRHVTDPPPQLLSIFPTAPPQLDRVIQWLMAKDPQSRPQTPLQAASTLASFCTGEPTSSEADLPQTNTKQGQTIVGHESNANFRLPKIESLAHARERDQNRRSQYSWMVLMVAIVALSVFTFLLVQFRLRGDRFVSNEYTNAFGIRFALIPPGKFMMGSPETEPDRTREEGPQHEVSITEAFYMSITEVTNQQYIDLIGSSPAWTASRVRQSGDLPTESVTWLEAKEFCRKLNERDRSRRNGWLYRLPTEAEWEYACRSGTTTAYSFGEQLSEESGESIGIKSIVDDGNTKRIQYPNKVGCSKANTFGLYDVHGNVSEWCQDYFQRSYPSEAQMNPQGPNAGDIRVIRGGSYISDASQCRSATRRGVAPEVRDRTIGFRIVLAAATTTP
jgi:eukaryotic-like serine/threonine-protein kinase